MGIWKAFTKGRNRSGRLHLKEYDHSVGFTLKTEDQFYLEVPKAPTPTEVSIGDYKIPIVYSFSSIPGNGPPKDTSTVSSITTNSTDSSSVDTLQPCETTKTGETQISEYVFAKTPEEENSMFGCLLTALPCWWPEKTRADSDWSPADDAQSTPSYKTNHTDPIEASRGFCGCGGDSAVDDDSDVVQTETKDTPPEVTTETKSESAGCTSGCLLTPTREETKQAPQVESEESSGWAPGYFLWPTREAAKESPKEESEESAGCFLFPMCFHPQEETDRYAVPAPTTVSQYAQDSKNATTRRKNRARKRAEKRQARENGDEKNEKNSTKKDISTGKRTSKTESTSETNSNHASTTTIKKPHKEKGMFGFRRKKKAAVAAQ